MKQIKVSDFVSALQTEVANGDLYVWGGNGEYIKDMKLSKLVSMEQSIGRVVSILKLLASRLDKGYDVNKIRCVDCSGLMYACLKKCGLTIDDTTASGFQCKCSPVALKNLRAGDFVFNQLTKATHIGCYIGNGKVIESQGRAYGVVCRELGCGSWIIGGRPDFYKDEPNHIGRILKLTNPIMVGDDVKALQKTLNAKGYNCGTADGEFGNKTHEAVKSFQKANGLTVDGIVGYNTATALDLIWEG